MKEVYKTLDQLIEAYQDGNFPHGKIGVECEVFKYINSLNSPDRHKYLKYYFEKVKTRG